MSRYDCDLNLDDKNSLSILVSRIKPNSIVLEFGPANGRMTKYMKEQLNCRIYAVEIDEKSAKDARIYTEKILVDSIENNNWQKEFKDIKFDYIIFADVLEHLYYPEKVLKNSKDFLKEDGSILISIPNIAHNSIVMNLLKNEFNYNATGLLDDTHIRFFTKKTFDKLIKSIGCFPSYETAIFIKPEETEFANTYDELKPEVSKYIQELPYGEIYQIIYEIKKYKTQLVSDFKDEYKNYIKNFIQLFIEDEKGTSEENSIKFAVSDNNNVQKFEFDLTERKNIKSLRLDPLNEYAVLKIHSIKLNGENYLNEITSNAFYKDGDIYYFHTQDSQIYLNINYISSINTVCFDLEYLYISEDALKQVYNIYYQTLKTKELELANVQTELANVQTELANVQTELANVQTELANIYVSKSWKIIRILRDFMRIFKK